MLKPELWWMWMVELREEKLVPSAGGKTPFFSILPVILENVGFH